jgi:hypothetical protein
MAGFPMSKKTLLFPMFALVLLAACSKPAPQPAAATDEDEESAPRAAVEKPVHQETAEERAKQAEGLLGLIDPSPTCQPFRDELQEAGRTGTVPIDDMIKIVVRAGKAGCNKKRD